MPRGRPGKYGAHFCTQCGKRIHNRKVGMAMRQNGRPPTTCGLACFKKVQKALYAESIQEPDTAEEVEDADWQIRSRKRELSREEIELIESLTPPEDSPEAERRLRERVCPDPPAYLYVATGTSNGKLY